MDIQVVKVTLQKYGSLRALVAVLVGKTRINAYRVVQQEGQQAFVQPPQVVGIKQGKEAFFGPVVVFPNDIASAISKAVLDAYEAEVQKVNP